MKPMGGKRPGAGRKPRLGEVGRRITLRLDPATEAEIVAGLLPGETLSDALREGALLLVRSRS